MAAKECFHMKQYIIKSLWFLITFQALQSSACDVCNMYDYTGRQNKSFVGLFYRYRVMNGYSHINPTSHRFFVKAPNARVDHDISGSNFYQNKTNADFQKYQVVDLRFNYALKEKINIGAIVPFSIGQAYYAELYYLTKPMSDSSIHTKGFGDVLLFSDYVFSKKKEKWRTFVKPGIALKLPTGNSKMGTSGKLFPHEVQAGTGTFDFLIRLNANARYKNVGLEWVSNYRFNGASRKHDYKFGNSFNINLNPYYVIDLGEDFSIVPKTGIYAEMASFDRQGTQRQLNTGGRTLYANVGLDVVYEKINIQTLFQKPINDRLYGEQMGNAGRVVLGLIYNF